MGFATATASRDSAGGADPQDVLLPVELSWRILCQWARRFSEYDIACYQLTQNSH